MDHQRLLNRVEELCDFAVAHQKDNGELDLEEGHFLYPAGINMRALAAAYKLTGKEKYLSAVLKWTDRIFAQQNEDGSFWASSTQLEDSYGRFVSDTANGLNVVYNILSYLDADRKENYLAGMKQFVDWTVHGDEGRPFLLDNGAIGCGVYKDEKEKGRPECLECTAISPCTFLTPYYRLTRDNQYLQIATRAVQYILSKRKPDGIFPYISKTWSTPDPQGDKILHVLNYVLEGLVYFYEHSGIEFFDPLAVRIRQSIKASCRWLAENQRPDGRWNTEPLGNNAAKSAGLVLPLVWYQRIAPQDPTFQEHLQPVRAAIEKAARFLLSDEAVDGYGVLTLVRQNGFGAMALAEILEPGVTLFLDPSQTATAELFPMEILSTLPEADSPFAQMKGWIQQGDKTQTVFWHSQRGCVCEAHSHPYPEWGTVVSGYTELTIDDETKWYGQGDSFFVPSGAIHSATMSKNYRAIDLFASPTHVKQKN